jgi:hypothetical protein
MSIPTVMQPRGQFTAEGGTTVDVQAEHGRRAAIGKRQRSTDTWGRSAEHKVLFGLRSEVL